MIYRTVGDRLAVDFYELELPMSDKTAIEILESVGFEIVEVEIVEKARENVGISKYRRGARLREAPSVFDCSGFVKWVYGQAGIWLPRRSIQQYKEGVLVEPEDRLPGDIVFRSGWIDYYWDDPKDGIGHVGLISNFDSVIHAANRQSGIIESAIDSFLEKKNFRGIRRVIPRNGRFHVFKIPTEREVEISDDLRWIILQNLAR